MKKLKILTMVLIVIALIIGVTYNVLGNEDSRKQLDINDDQDSKSISIWEMTEDYNNVYCIEHSQKMRGAKTFSINTKVVINGTTAEFYTKKNGSDYNLEKTVNNEANNVLAAILTNGDIDGKTGVRDGSDSEYTYGYKIKKGDWVYSDAQLGLYEFIDEWVSAVGANQIDGFALTNRALTGNEKKYAESVVAQAQSKATKYSYHITLYVLTTSSSAWQSLLVTEPKEPTPTSIELPVEKVWLDNENKYNTRPVPEEVTVRLLANDVKTDKTLKLNSNNGWKDKFTNLQDKDENNKKITYTIEEIGVPGYDVSISGNQTNGYKITNRLKRELTVIKQWDDEDDLDDIRPTSITVKLLANGNDTGRKLTLDGSEKDENGNWIGKFTDLYKCDLEGKVINYTLQEEIVEGYTSTYSKTEDAAGNVTYIITNKHTPYYAGYIEITGKVWNDLADGKANAVNGVLDDDESGISGIKVILKDANGKQFDTTSYAETDENGNYAIKVNYDNSKNVYKLYEDSNTVLAKLNTAYVEFEYDGIKYTTVATATTGANTSKAIEDENARNKMDSTYSTVTLSTQHPDHWDGGKITAKTKDVISFENYSDKVTTSRKEVLKYCNGDGTYIRTNNNNAWEDIITGEHSCTNCSGTGHAIKNYEVDVQIIQNVNLGLFKREEPKVAIFTDLSKVEVTMNGQKYTYLYGVRSDKYDDVPLKVKFQNKDTYTYRRPVNPANVSYIQEEANKDAMSVLVTYEISIGNLSSTLPIKIHNIINYYELEYTLLTDGWMMTNNEELDKQFNTATYKGDLDINLAPGTESDPFELTYSVSVDAIRNLLNEEATLNNAVEISSYSTIYGEKTLYAEQRTGGRTGKPYAGYDYDSHPGNLIPEDRLYINSENRLEIRDQEPDEDIAPSFVLCKDDDTILSGTIWEDTDVNTTDDERLGNGYYEEGEQSVENIKVELYQLVADAEGNVSSKLAQLYDSEGNAKDAVVYTDSNGYYAFEGVVTGEYFIKIVYGDDTAKLGGNATTMDGGNTTVNARNYKSTIITDSTIKDILNKGYTTFSGTDKMWHITHQDGYSVAVDNMLERLGIEDLQNSNYSEAINMTAYTKPFETQVEFETTGESQVEVTESELENKVIQGNIGIPNELNKIDFGIIERPREDLFVETTITYFEIALANTAIITKGNPVTETLKYAKAIALDAECQSGEDARDIPSRKLVVEVDNELIQGATAKIQYETRITNNNEIDYDYGVSSDYTDIVNSDNTTEYDKYITQSEKANYYYYGDSSRLNEIKATLMYVDYLNKEVGYTNSTEWVKLDANELYNQGLINSEVYSNTAGRYLLRKEGNETITLARGETFTQTMLTTKAGIANDNKNSFDNSLEIIRIDGKTARTIEQSDEGKQVEKTYIPGNYVPGYNSSEQDDDVVINTITPPTGTNYIITYVITAFVGLIVICSAIIFIKKKVLTK